MFEQTVIVAVIVIGCSAYSAWTLMPTAARRAVARALLKLPLPQRLAGALQKHLAPASGCGCDGCDQGTKLSPKSNGAQAIRFHPRVRR